MQPITPGDCDADLGNGQLPTLAKQCDRRLPAALLENFRKSAYIFGSDGIP
jgi:hypothetical protein